MDVLTAQEIIQKLQLTSKSNIDFSAASLQRLQGAIDITAKALRGTLYLLRRNKWTPRNK